MLIAEKTEHLDMGEKTDENHQGCRNENGRGIFDKEIYDICL